MKLIHNNKNNWKKINKIILRVDNADLLWDDDLSIVFDCGFENISKGEVQVCFHVIKTKNHQKNFLFIQIKHYGSKNQL